MHYLSLPIGTTEYLAVLRNRLTSHNRRRVSSRGRAASARPAGTLRDRVRSATAFMCPRRLSVRRLLRPSLGRPASSPAGESASHYRRAVPTAGSSDYEPQMSARTNSRRRRRARERGSAHGGGSLIASRLRSQVRRNRGPHGPVAFEEELDKARDERPLQRFLEERPQLLATLPDGPSAPR